MALSANNKGVALGSPTLMGLRPLRVLRTWATPNAGCARSFEEGGPRLYTLPSFQTHLVLFLGFA